MVAQIRRVEDVVAFNAEIQTHSLTPTVHREVSSHSHVRHNVAGSDKCVSADRAERSDGRVGEGINVEVLLDFRETVSIGRKKGYLSRWTAPAPRRQASMARTSGL